MTDSSRRSTGVFLWLGGASAILLAVATVGALGIVPEDASQGVIQRIFYFHVAVALCSMIAFLVACVAGIIYLRGRDVKWDDIGSAACGVGLLYAVLTVVTGSIWAKGAWGFWWRWDDTRLVTFLLIILLYAAYFVLRGSADDARTARFAAVYAIIAFAAVPLSFWIVRRATSYIHPVVISGSGVDMPTSMFVWFLVSMAAFIGLMLTFIGVERQHKRAQRALADLKQRLDAAH